MAQRLLSLLMRISFLHGRSVRRCRRTVGAVRADAASRVSGLISPGGRQKRSPVGIRGGAAGRYRAARALGISGTRPRAPAPRLRSAPRRRRARRSRRTARADAVIDERAEPLTRVVRAYIAREAASRGRSSRSLLRRPRSALPLRAREAIARTTAVASHSRCK